MKILICEDELGVIDVLKRYLKSKGFDSDHAVNGKVALEAIKSIDYDIVFLDLNMPEVTGTDLLQYMKNSNYKAKVIVLTGYPGIKIDFYASLGVDRYLEKPIDLKVIGDIIDKYAFPA